MWKLIIKTFTEVSYNHHRRATMGRKYILKFKPSGFLQSDSATDIWVLKLPLAGSRGSAASGVAPPRALTVTTRHHLNFPCACLQILFCFI